MLLPLQDSHDLPPRETGAVSELPLLLPLTTPPLLLLFRAAGFGLLL